MSHTVGVRQAQKQKTRQALLDAALVLLEEQSLSSLGIREVTRAVGVAPTAFYRHFRSTADLGIALVEEALGSLHPLIESLLAEHDDSEQLIAHMVDLISAHVQDHPSHVRFLARERHGGVQPVRAAMATQLQRFAEEVRVGLATQAESRGWGEDDLLMLSRLYVDHMVMTASELVEAEPGTEEALKDTARRQMLVIHLGRAHWLDHRG
ncbi:TetR family transcriptional regulator [Streptomyces physcomitrii]|uniref:TetR family transcriptional regulator n=1 Tax=Streptomyces physcomitrii TaxID=2724184 RepID=A0ABX1H910_9ACTN|nr:TetR family transcriptional regulator [Streptomyces physcomitrii]NKI44833.1 TetR family transcriptional regulator [Streptomyces physcomitrii]